MLKLLEIKNLSAGYRDFEVLRNLSLEVGHGEAVVLIGPNGAGKSTVLKSIMGLTKKTGGKIFFKGRDITNLATPALLETGIGFVPQGRLVFPNMTVLENLKAGGYLLNHAATLRQNLERVFGFFPVLRRRARARGGALSGGEQQMLAIGRALMTTPELLMLDEPSLGLSPKITAEVFSKLKEIQAAGATLLIVEQNVRLVLKHVARGYLLSAGQIKFTGSAAALADEKLMHSAFLM